MSKISTVAEFNELAGEIANHPDQFEARDAASRITMEGLAEYESRVAIAAQQAGLMPVLAGGIDSPVHPLAAPTMSGAKITVDMMLKNPTRVTHMIMDLSLQRFISERLLADAGGVEGGAVIYDQTTANELYTKRDVKQVKPAGEFPIITSERLVPKVAEVEKWGGKVFIPVEARDRNQTATMTNKFRQLTNTIIRKNNQIAMAVVAAAITAGSRTMTGVDWGAVVTGGSSQSNNTIWPGADIIRGQTVADTEELGVSYDLLILNPVDYAVLAITYGEGLNALLQRLGVNLYVSNRKAQGSGLLAAEQQAGERRTEKPLGTETWEDKDGRQVTWVQASVRHVMYVTNGFALLQINGINPTP
jgi:hypothetical protein